jgi:putative hydrolase of the HAD superfamily
MYKHLFFDLDRTLWDFEKNSHEVLQELYLNYNLQAKGVSSVDDFINRYIVNNEKLWDLYRNNLIEKERLRDERFRVTLKEYGIYDNDLAASFGQDYIHLCPKKTHLFPYVHLTLDYLKNKYKLHIITNGFDEVQHQKIEHNQLSQYFEHIITSEQVGYKKPKKEIFEYSLKQASAKASESLMIGDDLIADIDGARNAGMHQVYFNPNFVPHKDRQITYEINCLSALKQIL